MRRASGASVPVQPTNSTGHAADYQWLPERLVHYPLVEHLDLSADGTALLFTVRTAVMAESTSEFRHQLLRVSTAGDSTPLPLSFEGSVTMPRWSPDGRLIACLRELPQRMGTAELWVMRADGGEAWPLAGPQNGVRKTIAHYAWSPDSRRIAFVCVPWDEEHHQRVRRQDDAVEWQVDYNFAQLHLVDLVLPAAGQRVPVPSVTQLTRGRRYVLELDWSPDGSRIAFTHMAGPQLDFWPTTRLASIAADGSQAEPTDLGLVASRESRLRYGPDGRWIACVAGGQPWSWSGACRATLFAAAPSVAASHARALADLSDQQPELCGWSADGSQLYVYNQNGLGTELVALPIDGGPGRVLLPAQKLLGAHSLSAAGQLALVAQDFQEPNALYLASLAAAAAPVPLRRVVQPPLPPQWPQAPLPQVRLLRWRSADGFDIDGILYLPADYPSAQQEQDPTATGRERLPCLLHIHGGPMSLFQRQYVAHPYYYVPAALCERGMAVLRCNPRGSGGYGSAFRSAVRKDWGGGDYRDLIQGLDTVIELGIADPQRLGVCGWSYGGYLTSWAITQTDRFRAASIGAAVVNLFSFTGTSDIPGFLPDYFGDEFWEDPTLYQARSPLFQVQQVGTPAMIQHGADDRRVPLEQGLQFHNALRRRGVPVEMTIYPREAHNFTEPRHIIHAAQQNLDWFTTMLWDEAD